MELDPRIKTFKLTFPTNPTSRGLKPMRTYRGRLQVEVVEPVPIKQLKILFEGWEMIEFGTKIGSAKKLIFRTCTDLLQSGEFVDSITSEKKFDFTCTMPNVNFPSAMHSSICEVSYTISASLVGSVDTLASHARTMCSNNVVPLAFDSIPVQITPKVIPSGVGWLKALVMRDGIMLTESSRRRFRRQVTHSAMNICVQVKNHCCTLNESISVDVDVTMLQKERVLTFVRAAVIEQVSLKTHTKDTQTIDAITAFLNASGRPIGSTVILAERTLNRKVSELDPSILSTPPTSEWGASGEQRPMLGLNGVQNMRIRVPRRNVCTSEGFLLQFTHVLRITFGLTSRPASGHFDTKYASKDIPLRLVTSKFGDVGHVSQVEIDKRLSALTTESDCSAVSAAYGYLLSENSRAARPSTLEMYADHKEIPAPIIKPVIGTSKYSYTPPQRRIVSSTFTPSSSLQNSESRFGSPYTKPKFPRPLSAQVVPTRVVASSPALPSRDGYTASVDLAGVKRKKPRPATSYEPYGIDRLADNENMAKEGECFRRTPNPDDCSSGQDLGNGNPDDSLTNESSHSSTSTMQSEKGNSSVTNNCSRDRQLIAEKKNAILSLEDSTRNTQPKASRDDSTPESCGTSVENTIEGRNTNNKKKIKSNSGNDRVDFHDKRGSSQSEGVVTVYSGSSPKNNKSELPDTGDMNGYGEHTRSNTPDIKYTLDDIDVSGSRLFDDMTKDLLNSSALFFDDSDSLPYWQGVR